MHCLWVCSVPGCVFPESTLFCVHCPWVCSDLGYAISGTTFSLSTLCFAVCCPWVCSVVGYTGPCSALSCVQCLWVCSVSWSAVPGYSAPRPVLPLGSLCPWVCLHPEKPTGNGAGSSLSLMGWGTFQRPLGKCHTLPQKGW